MLLDLAALEKVVRANPFVETEAVPNTLNIGFMVSVPDNSDIQLPEKIQAEGEQFQIIAHAFYLHAPEGVGDPGLRLTIHNPSSQLRGKNHKLNLPTQFKT